VNIDAFDFWKIITNFKKFNKKLPDNIFSFLDRLERKLIKSLVWKKDSQIHDLITELVRRKF